MHLARKNEEEMRNNRNPEDAGRDQRLGALIVYLQCSLLAAGALCTISAHNRLPLLRTPFSTVHENGSPALITLPFADALCWSTPSDLFGGYENYGRLTVLITSRDTEYFRTARHLYTGLFPGMKPFSGRTPDEIPGDPGSGRFETRSYRSLIHFLEDAAGRWWSDDRNKNMVVCALTTYDNFRELREDYLDKLTSHYRVVSLALLLGGSYACLGGTLPVDFFRNERCNVSLSANYSILSDEGKAFFKFKMKF